MQIRVRSNCALLAAVLAASSAGAEELGLPSIFGDHMVLQRGIPCKVWGWADPGEKITVSIADQNHETIAEEDGSWSLHLDPMQVGGARTLTVSGANKTITFRDVLIGEVWICSGQSNMQWAVAQANDADLEALTADYPEIRLISVPQVGVQEPQRDFNGSWAACSPETAPSFSAVGYFFGRQIHKTLDVPVGLIDDAWGGSAAEAWVQRDKLAAHGEFDLMLEQWAELEANEPGDEQARRGWNNQMRGNHRPGNIYNGVLKPTIGYGIRGVIWYQGESNAGRAYQYRTLFPYMIQTWRDEWGLGDFPFYFVQLADFMAEKDEPSDSAWAELREAQTMTLDALPHTGQAVIIDLGEAGDIHPKDKLNVGKRLARLALANDYGYDLPHESPRYDSWEAVDGKALVHFKHAGGLDTFDVREILGLTIAGEDRVFVPAQGRIVDEDTIEVWSEDVAEPAAVRYAWADNPVCNLQSSAGLPATPFRTDDWPGVTAENNGR